MIYKIYNKTKKKYYVGPNRNNGMYVQLHHVKKGLSAAQWRYQNDEFEIHEFTLVYTGVVE